MLGDITHSSSDHKWIRVINEAYPPLKVFEKYFDDPDELEIAYEFSMNEDSYASLQRLDKSDWISGTGASFIMPSFLYIGGGSRFSDGSRFGVFYASENIETSFKETIHHFEKRLKASNQKNCVFNIRAISLKVKKPLVDLRNDDFEHFQDPDSYLESNRLGRWMKEKKEWGLFYNSVRNPDNSCVAIFRPSAIHQIKIGKRYTMHYSQIEKKITDVFEQKQISL